MPQAPLTGNVFPSPHRPSEGLREQSPTEPTPSRRRGGCKDDRLDALRELLGHIPDADVARRAGVSVRTVASFRAKHRIPGFCGVRRSPLPRGHDSSRLDRWHDLVGHVPDHVVAERAGMSLGAVRNYRLKHEIEPCGRMTPAAIAEALARQATPKPRPTRKAQVSTPHATEPLTPTMRAWSVHLRGPSSERQFVVLATDIAEAGAHAQHHRRPGEHIIELHCCGVVLTSP